MSLNRSLNEANDIAVFVTFKTFQFMLDVLLLSEFTSPRSVQLLPCSVLYFVANCIKRNLLEANFMFTIFAWFIVYGGKSLDKSV